MVCFPPEGGGGGEGVHGVNREKSPGMLLKEMLVVRPAGSYFLIRRLLHVSPGENQSMKKKRGIVK